MVTVGVLATHTSKESKAICNAVEALGHEAVWLGRESTTIELRAGEVRVEPDADVIANRLLVSSPNAGTPTDALGLAATLARVRPMLNEPAATLTAVHKIAAAVTLTEAGVRVPDALLALAHDRLNAERDRFGPEAVYKTAVGTHGGGTWKVATDRPVNPMVGDRQAFLQSFVDTPGEPRDVRVYVVGNEVVGAMTRHAPAGDWRTNVALGGAVTAADDLPSHVHETALAATDAIGLSYAGVDLVEGTDGWYVLEVNPTAGFRGLFRATERSPAPRIAAQAIRRAGGEADPERVAALATELDDSRPACLPRPPAGDPADRPTVGYIERVVVAGTRGSTETYAKSDTGATRSSIDTGLAADVGAGPIKRRSRVKSGSSASPDVRPVVDLVIGVGGRRHTVTANVQDRSHMSYPLLLGRDVLREYHVDVSRRADGETSEE